MSEPEFYLQWRQQWRVFTTQKHIYSNGVWIEIDNVHDLTGKPKGFLAFFEDWQKLEWQCWHDGILGWFCAVYKDNTRLQRLITAVGGVRWREDEEFIYFHKHTLDAPETMTFKQFHVLVDSQTPESTPHPEPEQPAEEAHAKPTV